MALVSQITPLRKDIPDEPGEWVDIVPPSVLALDESQQEKEGGATVRAATAGLLVHCVKAWSYDAPLTPASFSQLDRKTWDWLVTEINMLSGLEESEKKDSVNGSSPTTGPALAASPVSSSS